MATALANWHDETAANGQLFAQRGRNNRTAGGNDNCIVRRIFRPAQRAIPQEYLHVVISKLC
jgi:hypothetical protein